MIISDLPDSFKKKIKITEENCWLWTGTMANGYGWYKGMYAHRYVYEFCKGQIPLKYYVTHECDNSWCVNPEHLTAANQSKNEKDAYSRGGKSTKGIPRPRGSKYTLFFEDVVRMRSEGLSYYRIDKELGLPKGTSRWIVRKA